MTTTPPPQPDGARWRRAGATAVAGLHLALVPYTLFAWIVPDRAWLTAHAVFVPLMVLHWSFNRGVCVLSNLESWLTTGRWWDEQDPSQGGWVDGLITRWFGRPWPRTVTTALTYLCVLAAGAASAARLVSLE